MAICAGRGLYRAVARPRPGGGREAGRRGTRGGGVYAKRQREREKKDHNMGGWGRGREGREGGGG